MAGGGEAEASGDATTEITLQYTPTWIVAAVCSVIVLISLLFERMLHRLGKVRAHSHQASLYHFITVRVCYKLMLLGFISLMLGVFQGATQKICVNESVMRYLLPCPLPSSPASAAVFTGGRRLLSGGGAVDDYCLSKGKVPILSLEALHQLDLFIFNLAVTHVVLSLITFGVGVAQRSFFKQFYGSVTEEDYTAMRLGFIAKHCRGNPKFNFYSYMIRAFEADYKKVVGISWYLWASLMIFLLLNLLLAVGCKMEHVIIELAVEVAQKHTAIEGDVIVAPSDDFFWFHRPKLVLYLIHFILFQIAFEIAFFFWILVIYEHQALAHHCHTIAASRILCGYSTLPLYVIVSHMGSSFKKAIFDDNVSEDLVNWAQSARRRKGNNKTSADTANSSADERHGGVVQMT
ncbi:hypothetical protein U9M48_012293 [Paspalum notatum var. saurae]|uniref:MLO-like protein n=1 Tax=Paspalum notatum var. saurae TaxID=547442 RepID=A0AAQ3SXK1_PASNO